MIDYVNILEQGIWLMSSGTTGESKKIFQPPEKIRAACLLAQEVQGINSQSKIYTVCKTTHAAGLLAQTLPALSVKAQVVCRDFNAYDFCKEIRSFTHTHLTPRHARAIMQTKNFSKLNLSGITVVCGADPVTWDIIEAFVEKGCTFIANWGMTEIGPIAIWEKFTNLNQVEKIKALAPPNTTVLGSNLGCQVKIDQDELSVKGSISVYGNQWYATGDLVVKNQGIIFYRSRKNLDRPLNFALKS